MNENLDLPEHLRQVLHKLAETQATARQFGASDEVQRYLSRMLKDLAFNVSVISGLPKCQLASPHKDIQTGYDSAGNLRLECLHAPMHCWDLSGNRKSC